MRNNKKERDNSSEETQSGSRRKNESRTHTDHKKQSDSNFKPSSTSRAGRRAEAGISTPANRKSGQRRSFGSGRKQVGSDYAPKSGGRTERGTSTESTRFGENSSSRRRQSSNTESKNSRGENRNTAFKPRTSRFGSEDSQDSREGQGGFSPRKRSSVSNRQTGEEAPFQRTQSSTFASKGRRSGGRGGAFRPRTSRFGNDGVENTREANDTGKTGEESTFQRTQSSTFASKSRRGDSNGDTYKPRTSRFANETPYNSSKAHNGFATRKKKADDDSSVFADTDDINTPNKRIYPPKREIKRSSRQQDGEEDYDKDFEDELDTIIGRLKKIKEDEKGGKGGAVHSRRDSSPSTRPQRSSGKFTPNNDLGTYSDDDSSDNYLNERSYDRKPAAPMPRGRSFAKPDDRRLQTKRRDTDKPDSEGDDTSLERATKKGSKRNIPFSRRRENLVIPVTRECELMTYLLEKLKDKNKNNIKSLLKDRQVIVNNLSVSVYNHKLNPGDRLEITPLKKMAAKSLKGFSILYEDDHIIVIDKHSGVLSIADNRTSLSAYSLLSTHVKMQHPSNKIFVVHRLDRETSGLMMFAKSEEVQQIMQESWYDLVTERSYAAVVEGKIEPAEGSITSFLTESKDMVVYSTHNEELGKKAITFYSTVKSNEKYSLVKATLETGRKNQVRVHLKDLGHSIVGDKKYGSKSNPIGRLALHAWVFSFIHPVTRAQLKFENNLPRKFAHLI